MSDFRSAIALAKSYPGSVVRRLPNGGFGVFNKSGLRIMTIHASTNKNEFPVEVTQLAELEQFDSLVEQWEEAHRRIDRIVELIHQVGEAPVEAHLRATGFVCSSPITQVIENFFLNRTDGSSPNSDTLRFLRCVRLLDMKHMAEAVHQIKKLPNASFISGIDILMGMKDRDELFESWNDAYQKIDRLWDLIKSYGRGSVDRCFARQEDVHLSIPVSVFLERLNLESIQSVMDVSPVSRNFLTNCKKLNIDSFVEHLESADRSHQNALRCSRLLLDQPCVEFFFFDDEEISMCKAVSIVPSKKSNIKHVIEAFCRSSDLETHRDSQDWLLRNKDWLECEIKEQAKYLVDSSESAGVRYLDYLESRGMHLNKESEVVILRLFGWTLEQVGDRFNVTRERIRQIEAKALRKVDSKDRFALLVKKRKQILQEFLRTQKRELIYQIIEDHGPLSEEEIQEKFGSEKLNFANLFSKPERARFLPKQRSETNSREIWNDEEILDAIRSAATMAFPLTHKDYTDLLAQRYFKGPSVPAIIIRFRSWRIACERAGVESGKTNRTLGSGSKFNEKDLLDSISRYIKQGRTNTFNDYEDWAKNNDAPSGATLRNRLGTWRDIMNIGLRNLSEQGRED